MAHQVPNEMQSLAIQAVRHGRQAAEMIAAWHNFPIGDLPRNSLNATLRRFEAGDFTDGRDLITIEGLRAELTSILSLECTGSTCEDCLIGYDEDGEIWGLAEVPTYTFRGERARSVYDELELFLEARKRLIDYANAERLSQRLMR